MFWLGITSRKEEEVWAAAYAHPLNYQLVRNDCRHFCDHVVAFATGVRSASALVARASLEQRGKREGRPALERTLLAAAHDVFVQCDASRGREASCLGASVAALAAHRAELRATGARGALRAVAAAQPAVRPLLQAMLRAAPRTLPVLAPRAAGQLARKVLGGVAAVVFRSHGVGSLASRLAVAAAGSRGLLPHAAAAPAAAILASWRSAVLARPPPPRQVGEVHARAHRQALPAPPQLRIGGAISSKRALVLSSSSR